MLRLVLVSLAALAAADDSSCANGLTEETINPLVVKAQYAVRGRLLNRAMELEADLKAGKELPFDSIVRCNIGNPQALGQKPLTYVRQTLSLLMNPDLLKARERPRPPRAPALPRAEPIGASGSRSASALRGRSSLRPPSAPCLHSLPRSPLPSPQSWWTRLMYSKDAVKRAGAYAKAVPSVGAYSDSQGIRAVRQQVADFITMRDGHPASPDDVFLTDGASAGVKAMMQLLIRGPGDAVLTPVPQYPLYSAATALLNGTLAPYYLDEAASWGVHKKELERALGAARAGGAAARGLVVINPGNPTGQSLPKEVVADILKLAATEGLVLMADEVYQENIYGDAPPFTSFKSVLAELRLAGEAGDGEAARVAAATQLVSFHSTSKGFFGECGLRGGYFELQGFDAAVRAQLLKLLSVTLCSNVVGQFATGLMVSPPLRGESGFRTYERERTSILESLASRAAKIGDALNALPGITCNPAEGAMYLFPSLQLPKKAIAAAKAAGVAADEFYCIRLLEATGLVVVPGSGFGQVDGTYHFRTTFLPPVDAIDRVMAKLGDFQRNFLAEFAD